MDEAISDTGPLLHLHEIGWLETLTVFDNFELENAIDALFTTSTLHLSRAFRAYIRQLIANLP